MDHLLWAKFDGDVLEIRKVIAYYDEDDDELVLNRAHAAWGDMRAYGQAEERRGHFSTRALDHIVRHEIGHALHYRRMIDAQRAEIWYKGLTPEEKLIATQVSGYAKAGRIEFVAAVYRGLWGGRKFGRAVTSLYEELKGPPR
jgi:hypothetical protein